MGLYGGLRAQDIHQRKQLKRGQHILDHMGATELAANLFRATQTEEKLRREEIATEEGANAAHLQVGKVVRRTIQELGGTMPEELPSPERSIKELEADERMRLLSILEPEGIADGRPLQAVEGLRKAFGWIGLALLQPPLHQCNPRSRQIVRQ